MNLLIKKVSFFITTGIFLSLMACNSESYTDAQKPIRNLGGTSLKTQKEVGAELKAEMEERKKKIEARRQARLAQMKAGAAQPAPAQAAPEQPATTPAEPAVAAQAQPAPVPAPAE
ncbi:MAG: hypothetical protein K0U68_08560 [Gammaproteobacteria bacterium]|nr:hypothetical protein [Gammaproteobacteria bacterium]